ncbi:DUF6059 family protein [Streptomyces sp. NPDC001351]|uniref:DUF6059 family protein n=1 Tax=Streptomyces sp. NPDC001351 TaxID=3364564 RepID=UPI0036BADD9D
MSRRRRWAGLLARWAPGLLAVGCCLWGLPTPGAPFWKPAQPPPGHPERAAGHIPPSEVERELWAGLGLGA